MIHHDHRLYIERLLIAVAVFIVLMFLWAVLDLLVLVFGAIVIAVLLRAASEPILRWTPLGRHGALVVTLLLLVGLFALLAWAFGARMAGQLSALADALPDAWKTLQQRISGLPFGEEILDSMQDAVPNGNVVGHLGDIMMMLGAALADLLLVVFGAIFLAAQPQLYRTGLLKLLPARSRGLASEALSDSSRALRLWLLGQLIAMVVVGLLTFFGLWLIGLPSAAALGLIAGLLEIVPYAGPVVGAIPGLLVALMEGPEMTLWTLAVYLVVQQAEGNLLTPIVQRKTVSLPPALTLFGIFAAGLIFGVVGFIFAAPVLVVCYVMVKRLYVQEALNTPTPLPGDNGKT